MCCQLSRIVYPILLLLLFSPTDIQSQPYYFRHYQVENGLSNNSVYFIRQDSKGFIWIATKDGLNRFDGVHFKVFRIDSTHNQKRLSTNYIYCIQPRNDGWLWVGSQQGLFQFNPEREKLEPFIDSLKNIYDINIDQKGQMWFISTTTVCRYNFKTKTLQQYPDANYFQATSLCMSKDGTIWAGTQNGFLEKYNPENNSFYSFDLFSHSIPPNSKWIQKIHSSDSNHIFAGTISQGLKIFDIADSSYEDVLTYNSDMTGIFVREILQNSENEYWIATESGIFIYHSDTKTFFHFSKKFQDPYSLNDNAVYALCKDKEGGIWAGTFFGGVNYYAKQNAAFKKYFPNNSKNSISGNAVREIYKDKYGNLWIGTEDGALDKINSDNGKIEHFKPTGEKGSIAYTNVHGLLADGDNLWIGTFEHGIDLLNIKSGKVLRHYSTGIGNKGLKSNFALCFIKATDGKVIVGTSNGLYHYDKIKDYFILYPQIPLGSFVTSVIEDHNKIMWAGTNNSGAYWIDPATGNSGHLQNEIDKQNVLSNNSVNDVYEDRNGNIWFATEGGGISKLDSTRKNFSYFNASNGLPGNFVYKIIEDNEGKLWATTSNGLVKFGSDFKDVVVYTTANGLLSNQYNYHSGYKNEDGRLFFGSVKGMISFMPDEILKSNFSPPIYITGLQIFNVDINEKKDSSILKKAIVCTDEITLPYYQSSISIDFAALSYVSPEMTIYKYKLDGLDKSWTDIKTNRRVYFTNLPPGKYTFQLKASVDGKWSNGNEKDFVIIIKPPFWATWWAYLIYALSAICLIYYFINNYHKRQQEKKEKEIYESKIDFFTNVAHEIRTPLTLIKGPVENLLEKKEEMPEIKEDLDCLDRNTNRLMQLVSQVLDFRQTEVKKFTLDFTKVNVNELLNETFLRFKILAQKRKLDFELILPASDIVTQADSEALEKIFSNLVANAVKYAEKKVLIKILPVHKNSFSILFENDGHLIKKELAEKIFEPFYRIKETSYQKGTGIGLALARSLTELHNGSLELIFTKNNFNIFLLTLSLNTEASDFKTDLQKEIKI